MRRKMVSVGVGFLVISLLASCQTVMTEHPGAAVGAGAGAATGAVAGGLIGKGPGAVILGGLLGGLAGGLIGNYGYDQPRSRAETARFYHYDPSEGTTISIESASASPSVAYPGEVVNLRMTYALLTPGDHTVVWVREIREITHNGELVGDPEVRMERKGGTYESSVPLHLPRHARRGEYQVRNIVEVGNRSASLVTYFTVE